MILQNKVDMKAKEELESLCEEFFERADPSWWRIKEIVKAIIDKYHENWAKEYEIEVTEETSNIFYGNPLVCLECTKRAISDILSVSITNISVSDKIVRVKIKD